MLFRFWLFLLSLVIALATPGFAKSSHKFETCVPLARIGASDSELARERGFSDPYTFNTTSAEGWSSTTFDSSSFMSVWYSFSSSVDAIDLTAYDDFSTMHLPTVAPFGNEFGISLSHTKPNRLSIRRAFTYPLSSVWSCWCSSHGIPEGIPCAAISCRMVSVLFADLLSGASILQG